MNFIDAITSAFPHFKTLPKLVPTDIKEDYQNGSPYLPLPLQATIGQPEKQHKGSANRKRE